MNPLKSRMILITAVLIACLILVWPNIAYYLHLNRAVAPASARPEGPPPPDQGSEGYVLWQQEHPELAQWYEANKDYLAWEERGEELRARAIPLGLDLQGGVEVTLMLDLEHARRSELRNRQENLQRRLEEEKVTGNWDVLEEERVFTLSLADPANARLAANQLKNYEGEIELPPNAEETLAAGQTIRIGINEQWMVGQLQANIEGAKRAIQERIDGLGVAQARISLQGNPPDRVRLQVPGAKDPEKLIDSVIKPYYLEFRMIHQRNDELTDPVTGRLTPGAELPVGSERVPGKLGSYDPETKQMKYTERDFVVVKAPILTGRNLRGAGVFYDTMDIRNPVKVSLELDSDGSTAFADVTTKYQNQNRQMAILLDGVVHSFPTINDPITNGRAVIEGGFTKDEANDLSQILKAGSLPAPLEVENRLSVGATLGRESIMSGVRALWVGSLVVCVFMILYYGTAGVIAIIALLLNILIILAIMALYRATLTLSGIGGILLTVGMAVDGNVLIYERMRDELANGRTLRQAIGLGYHRAFGVVLDGNMTTLFGALVLLQFGEGQVKGFALTMTFGLLANLFTGLTVTHTLCLLWFNLRNNLSLGKLSLFKNANFDFIKARKYSYAFSIAVLLISLGLVALSGGLKFGVDFSGGFRAQLHFNEAVSETQVVSALLEAGLNDPRAIPVANVPNSYIIEVGLVGEESQAGGAAGATAPAETAVPAEAGVQPRGQVSRTEQLVDAALAKAFPAEESFTIEQQAVFGAQTSQQFSSLARWVVFWASLAVLIYLSFRYEFTFGVCSVVALVHDVTITTLLSAAWDVQITLEAVAALMVILGFSVNDTVVVFDRIRENARLMVGKSFKEICNASMNQTLGRTLVTTGTVLLSVIGLFLLGGEGLRPLAKIMLVGCIFGSYSTFFIATPLVYQWNERTQNRLQSILTANKKTRPEAAKPVAR